MDIICFFRAIFLLLRVVLTSAFQGNAAISGDAVLGGRISFTCSWTHLPNERVLEVTINYINDIYNNYYFQIYENELFTKGTHNSSRYILDSVEWTSKSVNMWLIDLQCSDEHFYYCIFKVSVNQRAADYPYASKLLTIKVPPQFVNIKLAAQDATILEDRTSVRIKDTIYAECSGVLGRSDKPRIDWIINRNCLMETIPTNDNRLSELINQNSLPGDPSCSQRVKQRLTVRTSQNDYVMAIICYLRHIDSPILKDPSLCWNRKLPYCNRTNYILMSMPTQEGLYAPLSSKNYDGERWLPLSFIIVAGGVFCISLGCIFGAAFSFEYFRTRM